MSAEIPGRAVELCIEDGGPHATYQALLEQHVLAFQACSGCLSAIFPPRLRCPRCGADLLTWRASAGRGAVYSSTVIAPRGQEPYAVVLIDLDEGYRMMSRIDDDAVAIGDRVVVAPARAGSETIPLFAVEGARR
ncbi:OB-fold domain-containing protein [Nocardioides sp. QY071]|uniref:Zn-ribbon domain-containing OB-fold protein n=1 Tax=Nocardioides sp. QY071 TaxID=3044187 RepID=UPI00249A9F8E|nr:OB-fold domain-containing protein [Nocardioides sp. QY071]WGY01661.1 OB-fold domain-containing protein [Nocardioides sp. QY071]